MTKTDEKPAIVKREVGEKVKLSLNLDPASTKDLGEGVLEAVITTSSVDRHRESIVTTGIDTKAYMQNPVVLYGHDYEGLPIGKTIKLTEQKNKIKARFQLAVDIFPFAKTVFDMVTNGYLNAVSIGGVVRQWSEDYMTIEEMEMVEFSVVPIPANPEALITSRSLETATGKNLDTIKEEFEAFSRKILLDKVADMGEDELTDAIRVMKNLIARLEETADKPSKDAKQTKRVTHFVLKDAKAVATQSQKLIKIVKLSIREQEDE